MDVAMNSDWEKAMRVLLVEDDAMIGAAIQAALMRQWLFLGATVQPPATARFAP
jgi:hypothetical protein